MLQWSINGQAQKGRRFLVHAKNSKFILILAFIKLTFTDDAASAYVLSRPMNQHPASDETFELVRNWLHDCDNHRPSSGIITPAIPPTSRLLDIGDPGVAFAPQIRLVDTLKFEKYAALSYCWGPQRKTYKITKHTLSDGYSAIDVLDLPLTLQDAVFVTRKLGLRYLWIDRLCIIQDDDADRIRELGRMPAIYGCAYITISAATASCDTEGFLGPRADRSVDDEAVQLKFRAHPETPRLPHENLAQSIPHASLGQLGTIILQPVRIGSSEETLETSLSDPIQSRGWTLQEHLLSPRAIVYGSRQLRWICESCQFTDGGRANKDLVLPFPLISVHERSMFESRFTPLYQFTIDWNWSAVVQEYSKRLLSRPEDKLIALGGLADRVWECLSYEEEDYLAGLWRRNFIDQMLWAPQTDRLKERPKKYRAPSWSWASVDSPIRYDTCRFLDEYSVQPQIYEVKCERESPLLKFGAVKSGHIVCRGYIRQVEICQKDGIYHLKTPEDEVSPRFEPDTLWKDGGHPNRLNSPLCLVIASAQPSQYWGLLLAPASGGGFQREGMWAFNLYPDGSTCKRFVKGRQKWFERCQLRVVVIK